MLAGKFCSSWQADYESVTRMPQLDYVWARRWRYVMSARYPMYASSTFGTWGYSRLSALGFQVSRLEEGNPREEKGGEIFYSPK